MQNDELEARRRAEAFRFQGIAELVKAEFDDVPDYSTNLVQKNLS